MRGLLAVLAALVVALPAHAQTVRLVGQNCSPVGANGDTVVYNSRGSNGLWDAFAGPACAGERLLPPYDGHRGASDVTPDGRYVLLETAVGQWRTSQMAEPGKGVDNVIERLDRQTGQVDRLVTGRKGTIWAEISDDGQRLMWSELEAPSDLWHRLLGTWSLHVADIVDGRLANEIEWQHPTQTGFIETYGWLPDGRVVFASDSGSRNPWMWWLGAQLWALPDDLTGPAQRLTPPFKDPTWCSGASWCSQWYTESSPYHEFAHVQDGWLYTSIERDAKSGMDLWRQHLDGSGRERVSWFGKAHPGWPAPRYVVVGSLAFTPDGILASVAGDANAQTLDAYLITPEGG